MEAQKITPVKEKQQLRVAIIVIGVLILLNLVSTCSSNSKVKSLTKTVRHLDSTVVELKARPIPMTDSQVRDAVKDESAEIMYKFLIYEDDLDKHKTSLSQIRSDIDRIKSGQ